MADYRETENLEEQLRRERRLAANHRRRKRIRWLLPLMAVLIAVIALVVWLFLPLLLKARQNRQNQPAEASAELVFVGDISLNAQMMELFRTEKGYDFSPAFRSITPRIFSADLAVGNLEGNVVDDSTPTDYNYPPALLTALYQCGFDVLQTANSYSIQNGILGLSRTKQAISEAGMDSVGTFSTAKERNDSGGVLLKDVNGIRIAFIAMTKGMNGMRLPEEAEHCVNLLYKDYDTRYSDIDKSGIEKLISNAKAEKPDVIIALVHWGSEYDENVTSSQEQIAKLLLKNGVDFIIGSHSHYVGPMQTAAKKRLPFDVNTGFTAYGLGDFLSSSEDPQARAGCVLRINLEKHGAKTTVTDIGYVPTYCVQPSEELECDRFEVLDSLAEMELFRADYCDRVSAQVFTLLESSVSRMEEQTDSNYMEKNP